LAILHSYVVTGPYSKAANPIVHPIRSRGLRPKRSSTPTPAPATINKKWIGRCAVRLKKDGSLDLDWRKARRPWWKRTQEERRVLLLEMILRNNPELTPKEAQATLDSIF
jgi:hypothetical protein